MLTDVADSFGIQLEDRVEASDCLLISPAEKQQLRTKQDMNNINKELPAVCTPHGNGVGPRRIGRGNEKETIIRQS